MSEGGMVRDECKECVVNRVRAAQCFQMAELGNDVGHSRRFCRSSCEDCEYYRRVQGLPTNVLVITSDERLLERLASEESDRITLRLARTAYEASAIVQNFQAAFVVVDHELSEMEEGELLDCLSSDARLPGVKVILAVAHGTTGAPRNMANQDAVFCLIEKPFGPRRIAAVVNSFPIEQSAASNPGVNS
jgi:CheY-like chemotaxis protein